ncbi:MAG: ShlB/FhaC/HecB family hemolysin secretion/activation protein [Sedimentisphaerales bacterium]|nr:ShlB/FhaC/HecB family hemolysin secretion/activation protein [Sedimentisphaerales bacterium]
MARKTRSVTSTIIFPILLFLLVLPGPAASGEQEAKSAAASTNAEAVPPTDDSPKFPVREIRILGNTFLSEEELLGSLPLDYEHAVDGKESKSYDFRVLHEIVAEPGQSRPVSKRTMEGFTGYILSRYRRRGFAGVYVYVSAETVEGKARLVDDVLQVRVIESRLAHVRIEHHRPEEGDPNQEESRVGMANYRFWLPGFKPVQRDYTVLNDAVLKGWSPAKPGQAIPKRKLEQFVALLNTNPDRHASAVLSASDEPNNVDLTYEINEGDPWHFYAQVDDAGTNERQWSPRVGVVNSNVTGRDDRLSLMYQLDVEAWDENYAGFGNYDFPFLTPRLRIGFYAGYSRFDIGTQATGGITSFLGDGSFVGATLRYNVAKWGNWLFDFTGSVSDEQSRVHPSLGTEADVDMQLYGVGAQIHRTAGTSRTMFSFERLQNYDGSSAERFAVARPGADPDFIRYSASAAHRQSLDANDVHTVLVRLTGVASNERLVPAKMTTFGGLYTVRGYEEDEIVADGGLLASLEYRYDLTQSLHGKQNDGDKRSLSPGVSLLCFTDYARPEIKDPLPGEFDTQTMWGAGLGTLIELGGNFQAGIYHGWALRETKRGDGDTITGRGDTQWNFNIIYRW